MFDTLNGAKAASKRIKTIHGVTRSQASEIVARAAGYQDWHQLERTVGTGSSPIDNRDPRLLAEYLRANPALKAIDPADVLDEVRPVPCIYATNGSLIDPIYGPDPIGDILRKDVSRFALALSSSTVLEQHHPDHDADLDRTVHLLEVRSYALEGAVPEGMTREGRLIAETEYHGTTVWALFPSDTSCAPVSLRMEGAPEATRDPILMLRLWRKVSEQAVPQMPTHVEADYAAAIERVEAVVSSHLPGERTFDVTIDALGKGRARAAAGTRFYTDRFAIAPHVVRDAMGDAPRAFLVEHTFMNQINLFPDAGPTRSRRTVETLTLHLPEGDLTFDNARSYALRAFTAEATVQGTRSGPLDRKTPIKPEESHLDDIDRLREAMARRERIMDETNPGSPFGDNDSGGVLFVDYLNQLATDTGFDPENIHADIQEVLGRVMAERPPLLH